MDFEKHHERMLLRHEKAIADIDKKLAATASLVRVGMKLIINDRKEQKEFNKEFSLKLNALIESQMRTEEAMRRTDEILRKNDEKFNRLMDRMLRKNGHGQQSS